VVLRFLEGIANNALRLAAGAADIVITFLNALASVIREKAPELRAAGANIATAILDGITGGLASKARNVAESAIGVARGAVGGVTNFLGISSPSKVFMEIGAQMAEGMAVGLSRDTSAEKSARDLANRSVDAVRNTMAIIADDLTHIAEFNPTITPVIDLSQAREGAAELAGLMPNGPTFTPNTSLVTAQSIATSANPAQATLTSEPSARGEVKFEQNIYAPEQLSTADIYKQTRNQITLAKEELEVI
jgi:hypothetical protein